MNRAIERFARYLRVERNASELTIKSYGEDLESFLDYCRERLRGVAAPDAYTIHDLRGYVSYLHECQYAKTTIARRLACLRTFSVLRARETVPGESGEGTPDPSNRAEVAALPVIE